jgi:hypothetical protein
VLRCVFGTYKYRDILFSMTNSPSCFQRVLDTTQAERLNVNVFFYWNDIVIADETMEQNMDEAPSVLGLFQPYGLRRKKEKGRFGM